MIQLNSRKIDIKLKTMNPLNTQHPAPQTQFFITTGMPPLTPTSATSILKTSTATGIGALATNHASSVNNQQTTNRLMETSSFVATASYVPVLLTNQTLITNVDSTPQQQHQQMQKMPTNLLNVGSSPVVSSSSIATMMPSTNNKSVVLTSDPVGNITYQLLASPQTQNLGSVLTSQNGTVSVLLTSAPPTTMAATTGHVAAPPLIIRNTQTALSAPNLATAASTQMNKQQQPIQQQFQQQFQQQLLSQTFNAQHLNPEILKQIVVGTNPSSNTKKSLAPGKTLLKSSLLQNKPSSVAQRQQQQPKLKNPQQLSANANTSPNMSPAFGMELAKNASVNNNNNNAITQTAQKLPQISLLQNSKNLPALNINIAAGTKIFAKSAATSKNIEKSTTARSEKINEKPTILKNSNEIRMGNLNSEVSLIKKSKMNGDKDKEAPTTSLLKKASQQDNPMQEMSLLKTNEISLNLSVATGNSFKEENKLVSIPTADNDLSKLSEEQPKVPPNAAGKLSDCSAYEKQESLLKPNNKSADGASKLQTTSPRNQRSKSCNYVIKTKQSCPDAINLNERRHSEPNNLDNVKIVNASDVKKLSKIYKLDIDSIKSDQINALLEEFEDEEYLECSGEKSEAISSNPLSEITIQSQEFCNSEQTAIEHENNTGNTVATSPTIPKNDREGDGVDDIKESKVKKMEQSKKEVNDTDSDDDVTILPSQDAYLEPIEIEDDDEAATKDTAASASPSFSHEKEKLNDSLLCDEQILVSSSSSTSNLSTDHISAASSVFPHVSPKYKAKDESITAATTTSPLLQKTLTDRKPSISIKEEPVNGYSTVLDMLSNYNMLNWRERIGTARGTKLKFQLNEFNLIQLHEKIPHRTKCNYEKPVYERDNLQIRTDSTEPIIYYMCRRCNVRASAVDFLAPEFCSLYCLRRDYRKRQRLEDNPCILRKKQRNVAASNNPPPLAYISQQKFSWSSYLKANFTFIAAPISLFLNPFPTGPNNFKIGMKLEAIDPENCSLFCVCTVADINGYRLKLSFDGYDSSYDFWLNADSMDIFPPGWCSKTNRILQPPKGVSANKFNWGTHLNKEKSIPAPRHLFTHLNSSSLIPRNPFQVGMHLEAEDLNDTGKLCVASVADVLDDRIRIHFDGWDDCYDIIVDINSPYIHPCGWHEGRQQLVVPPDCENLAFNWDDYIHKQNTGVAGGDEIFVPREPIHFRPNMKLEVVDPRNPSLIRPATVVTHKGHRVKLHMDGWPSDYCFWLEDDSPDLHPIGWCDATGHDLEPPPGFQMAKQKMPCPITGCRGIGNAKKSFMSVHASRDCCPYAPENWRIVMEKPPRVSFDDITRTLPRQTKQPSHQQNHHRLTDQEILDRLQMLDNIKTRNIIMQQDKVVTSPKDLLGVSSLATIKKEDAFDVATAVPTFSNSSSTPAPCKKGEDAPLNVNLEIAKEFLCDYGPRLQQSYNLWQNNFSFDVESIKRNPMAWSVSEVGVFVDIFLSSRESAALFAQEDIDGQAFLLLQQEDLTERLGLKMGPAVKLYSSILQLRTLAVTKFNVAYRKASKK